MGANGEDLGRAVCTIADMWPDSVRIMTGVDFWKRVWTQLNLKELDKFRAKTSSDFSNRLKKVFLLPTSHQTEVKWEGDDFIIDSTNCMLAYFEKRYSAYTVGEFALTAWVAKQWGFLSEDETQLGPNVSYEPCKHDIVTAWPHVVLSGYHPPIVVQSGGGRGGLVRYAMRNTVLPMKKDLMTVRRKATAVRRAPKRKLVEALKSNHKRFRDIRS